MNKTNVIVVYAIDTCWVYYKVVSCESGDILMNEEFARTDLDFYDELVDVIKITIEPYYNVLNIVEM